MKFTSDNPLKYLSVKWPLWGAFILGLLPVVLQQGIDLLRQRMQDEDLQRSALKALLDQRSAGAFVTGAQMDKSISRMFIEKRRAHAVQN